MSRDNASALARPSPAPTSTGRIPWLTIIRTRFPGLAAFGCALAGGPERWVYIGLAVYWLADLLDGLLARALHQETIFGAEFDILTDRIQICLFYVLYVSFHPEKTLVALIFLFEFMVLDHFLSNQFVRWPIRSPNYFYQVDRLTWWWLSSKPAKGLNTGLVTLLTICVPSIWPSLSVAVGLIIVRVYFAWRVLLLSADVRAARREARLASHAPGLRQATGTAAGPARAVQAA